MAWDFETDPEFQKKLDWIDEFIDHEVEPLTQLGVGLGGVKSKTYQKTVRPLQHDQRRNGRSLSCPLKRFANGEYNPCWR